MSTRGEDPTVTTRILVVDNYDSFVYTIVGYLVQLGAECDVRRNDAVTTADADGFDGVLLSPGPGRRFLYTCVCLAFVIILVDDIAGIGPSRKRALLRHFGSAKSVSRAGLPDLQAVDGISEAMAQQIYDYFHGGK